MKYFSKHLFLALFLFSGTFLFAQEVNINDPTTNTEQKHPLLANKFTF